MNPRYDHSYAAFRVVSLVHTLVEIRGRWQHLEVPSNLLVSAFFGLNCRKPLKNQEFESTPILALFLEKGENLERTREN